MTLSHDDETATIEIPAVNWHNSGLNHFFDELHGAFGAGHDLDQRERGILQQRWIEIGEVVDYNEANENADDYKL